MGRSHQALKGITLGKCPKCKKPMLPHRACGYCGYYKNREIVKVKTKLAKSKNSKAEEK